MTLKEQKAEYTEIKQLLKTALSNNLSSGALIGYTSNNTKLTYTSVTETNKLIREYNQLIAHVEHQIASLNFRGYSV